MDDIDARIRALRIEGQSVRTIQRTLHVKQQRVLKITQKVDAELLRRKTALLQAFLKQSPNLSNGEIFRLHPEWTAPFIARGTRVFRAKLAASTTYVDPHDPQKVYYSTKGLAELFVYSLTIINRDVKRGNTEHVIINTGEARVSYYLLSVILGNRSDYRDRLEYLRVIREGEQRIGARPANLNQAEWASLVGLLYYVNWKGRWLLNDELRLLLKKQYGFALNTIKSAITGLVAKGYLIIRDPDQREGYYYRRCFWATTRCPERLITKSVSVLKTRRTFNCYRDYVWVEGLTFPILRSAENLAPDSKKASVPYNGQLEGEPMPTLDERIGRLVNLHLNS